MTKDVLNRLSFRAYFENATLYDEDGNEYTKSFYLYDIAIYKDRDCGISRKDLENQLEEQGFSKKEIECIEDYEFDCYDGSWESQWFWFVPSVIEQCTGLKDKNGRPIFEGDIIKKPYNDFYEYSIHVISWEDGAYTTKRCLAMKNKKSGELKDCSNGGFCFSSHVTQDLANSFEVIGNVHKNAE